MLKKLLFLRALHVLIGVIRAMSTLWLFGLGATFVYGANTFNDFDEEHGG
jgi:hypothetical protein